MKEFEIEFKTKVKNTEEGSNGSWFNYYRCESERDALKKFEQETARMDGVHVIAVKELQAQGEEVIK